MMKIDLKKTCVKQTITRDDGQKIAGMITEAWEKEPYITVDFSNILIASVSFMDQAFGQLAFDYSKEVLKKKLRFINIDEYDRALLNDILISRYHQKELKPDSPLLNKRKSRSRKLMDLLEK